MSGHVYVNIWLHHVTLSLHFCMPAGGAAVQQLAVRLVSNTFKHPQLRGWVVEQRASLLDTMAGAGASSSKVRSGITLCFHVYLIAFLDMSECWTSVGLRGRAPVRWVIWVTQKFSGHV
jgi:hypothetical protein